MKERASFTFDKETLEIIDGLISSGSYRNKSHVVEFAIKLLNNNLNKVGEENERKS